jgi:hypothetical protein
MDKSLANQDEEDEKEEARKLSKKAERPTRAHNNDGASNDKHAVDDDNDNSDMESEPSEITLDEDDENFEVMTMGSFVKVEKGINVEDREVSIEFYPLSKYCANAINTGRFLRRSGHL